MKTITLKRVSVSRTKRLSAPRTTIITWIYLVVVLFALPLFTSAQTETAQTETTQTAEAKTAEPAKKIVALVPGDLHLLSTYTNFFYNDSSEDFFYHLNDRLLFMEKPDGTLVSSGLRTRLMGVVRWHKLIRRALQRVKRGKNNMITIDVAEPKGYRKAGVLLSLLGLRMNTTPDGKYTLVRNPNVGSADYFSFTLMNVKTIQTQLNKTHHLHLKLIDSEIPVAWDYEFLSGVTGLKLNRENFFEHMLKDERFSLLLGVMYRLSDRAIQRISTLVKSFTYAAWREIYRDKRLLMAMFVLSGGLRVHEDGTWAVPGGAACEPFWAKLTGKDPKKSPLGFLKKVALKDEGKLNYLYLFATFLPEETRNALFTGPNAEKMIRLYQRITLTEAEKISTHQFPGLKNSNFYTLLYALKMKDNQLDLPRGVDAWLKAVKTKQRSVELSLASSNGGTEAGTDVEFPDEPVGDTSVKRHQSGPYITAAGGAMFSDGGDFQTLIDINVPYYDSLLIPSPTREASFLTAYTVELGYTVKRLSLGLEGSYMSKKFQVDKPRNYEASSAGLLTQRLSSISFLLNAHYRLLKWGKLKVYGTVGGGMYFGAYKQVEGFRYITVASTFGTMSEKGSQASFGYHAGLSADMFLTKRLALHVNARYRFVEFNNMSGRGSGTDNQLGAALTPTYDGDLLFGDGAATGGRAGFYLTPFRYPGPESNLRQARFNLTGVSFHVGAKFYL